MMLAVSVYDVSFWCILYGGISVSTSISVVW